jgi:hypothetical protein
MLGSLTQELSSLSIRFGLANARMDVRTTLERAGVATHIGPEFMFHTLNSASDAFTSRAHP